MVSSEDQTPAKGCSSALHGRNSRVAAGTRVRAESDLHCTWRAPKIPQYQAIPDGKQLPGFHGFLASPALSNAFQPHFQPFTETHCCICKQGTEVAPSSQASREGLGSPSQTGKGEETPWLTSPLPIRARFFLSKPLQAFNNLSR